MLSRLMGPRVVFKYKCRQTKKHGIKGYDYSITSTSRKNFESILNQDNPSEVMKEKTRFRVRENR